MDSKVSVKLLGAARDVGRSAIEVEFERGTETKTFLLDCGVHLGYKDDERRYPKLSTKYDAVLITHYHLDHCGALPYLTERLNYDGAVYASAPTKEIVPFMIKTLIHDESRKNHANNSYGVGGEGAFNETKQQGESNGNSINITNEDVDRCVSKIIKIDAPNVEKEISEGVFVEFRKAAHVLGACIVSIKCFGKRIVYTGDFNDSPDVHLGSIDVSPSTTPCDVLITESTYVSVIRPPRYNEESKFFQILQEVLLENKGNVLVPLFALGRSQEISAMALKFCLKHGLKNNVYVCTGASTHAITNVYSRYSKRSSWCDCGDFDLLKTNKLPSEESLSRMQQIIMLAAPANIAGGYSKRVFEVWKSDRKSAVVFPGVCSPGTFGYQVSLAPKTYECRIETVNFPAHTDALGVVRTLHKIRPKHVVLVHGSEHKMETFVDTITKEGRNWNLMSVEMPRLESRITFSDNELNQPQLGKSRKTKRMRTKHPEQVEARRKVEELLALPAASAPDQPSS